MSPNQATQEWDAREPAEGSKLSSPPPAAIQSSVSRQAVSAALEHAPLHDDRLASPSTQPRSSISDYPSSDSEAEHSQMYQPHDGGDAVRRPVTPGGNDHSRHVAAGLAKRSHQISPNKELMQQPSVSRPDDETPTTSHQTPATRQDSTEVDDDDFNNLVAENEVHAGGDTPLNPQEYELTLKKGDKGLGFTVAGGVHSTGYFYVMDIIYEPAISEPLIQQWDHILQVNGVSLSGLTHMEAIDFLRRTPETVKLRMYRPPEDEVSYDTQSQTTIHSNSEPYSVTPSNGSTLQENEIDIKAKGPSVQDLIRNMESGNKFIRPHTYGRRDEEKWEDEIQHGEESRSSYDEVASGEGSEDHSNSEQLQHPDRTACTKSVHSTSGHIPPETVTLDSTTQLGHIQPEQDMNSAQVYCVKLKKPPDSGLGLSVIQGERGNLSALYVHNLVPNSVAAHDGKMKVGDRLLQVNGESVIGMAHNKAIALIKQAGSEVSLTLSRAQSKYSPKKKNKAEVDASAGDPANDNDTDSDVDSTTLDEEVLAQNHHDSADEREDHTFDSVSGDEEEGYQSFVRRNTLTRRRGEGGQQGSREEAEEEEDSWGDNDIPISSPAKNRSPAKPPRKTPPRRLPAQITNTWLQSLPLVKVPAENVHYQGRQLQGLVKQLKSRLLHDDPIEEFKALRHAKLTDNCISARKPENKNKNRYRNVLPYDANRVWLDGDDDYINASHVRVMVGNDQLHYIACQGPLQQTTGDFWMMIWQHQVQVIAMVTMDTENSKVRCHRYWPDSIAEPFTISDRFEISLVSVQCLEYVTIYHIGMEELETGRSHQVVLLNYTAWPEQGSPETGMPLLQYMKFLHLMHESGPIVVHCSAGIGRTGAFITIDVAVAMMERDIKFDLQRIVTDLRRQRQGMIQTKDQYVFCYKTCIEALEFIHRQQTDS